MIAQRNVPNSPDTAQPRGRHTSCENSDPDPHYSVLSSDYGQIGIASLLIYLESRKGPQQARLTQDTQRNQEPICCNRR